MTGAKRPGRLLPVCPDRVRNRAIRLGGEVFWISLGQAAVALGGLMGVRILTELLPPTIYGELALAMTVVAFAQMAIQQPLFEGSRRLFPAAAEAEQTAAFLEAMWHLALRVSVTLGGVGLVGLASLAAARAPAWLGLAAATCAVTIISTWSMPISGILNATRRRALIAGHEGAQQWLRFGVAAVLVWWIGPRSSVAMAGYAVAAALVLGSHGWFLRRMLPAGHAAARDAVVNDWKTRIVTYAWPFAAWGAALAVQFASARWALQMFDAPESVGLFAALHHVGYYPVLLMVGVLSKFLSPVIFNRAGSGEDAGRNRGARGLGKLLVASALGVTLIATAVALLAYDLIFALLVAPEYRSVAWLLPLQVLGSGLFASSQAASVLPMVATNTASLLKPKIFSAALGTALNLLGAGLYGLPGVVWAGIVTGLVTFLWIAGVGGVLREPRTFRSE
ncbi:hypothetical protein BH23ACI1_BH23ACI1_26750 [soil metagenome]